MKCLLSLLMIVSDQRDINSDKCPELFKGCTFYYQIQSQTDIYMHIIILMPFDFSSTFALEELFSVVTLFEVF